MRKNIATSLNVMMAMQLLDPELWKRNPKRIEWFGRPINMYDASDNLHVE